MSALFTSSRRLALHNSKQVGVLHLYPCTYIHKPQVEGGFTLCRLVSKPRHKIELAELELQPSRLLIWMVSQCMCVCTWLPLKNLSDIVYLFSCGYTDIRFHWLCYSDQTCSFFTSTLLWPTLNLSRRLPGVEKLLDYRGYYCGLKYASLYVGALSPGPIRFDWVYTGWHHLWEWRWWMNHSQNCFSDCVRPRALSLMRHTRTYKYAEAEHVMGEDVVYRSM